MPTDSEAPSVLADQSAALGAPPAGAAPAPTPPPSPAPQPSAPQESLEPMTIDRRQLIPAMARANVPLDIQTSTLKALDDADASIAKWRQMHTDARADLANSLLSTGETVTPELMNLGLALGKANGLIDDNDINQTHAALATGIHPETLLRMMRGLSEKYKPQFAPRESPGFTVGSTFTPIAQPATNEVQLASDAATAGTPNETKTAATSRLALGLMADIKQAGAGTELKSGRLTENGPLVYATMTKGGRIMYRGQDVTDSFVPPRDPAEVMAASQAFQASMADKRMAQQNAIQARGQDFQMMKDASDKINKVEGDYENAKAAADTLRSVVASAKAGNKFAAVQQPLEGTMATLKSQGFNRINTAEIGVGASAGTAYDRIAGWMGKATAGQPLDASVQKDLLDYADVLEKAAYQKYNGSFDATTRVYPQIVGRVTKQPPPSGGTPSGGPRIVIDPKSNKRYDTTGWSPADLAKVATWAIAPR